MKKLRGVNNSTLKIVGIFNDKIKIENNTYDMEFYVVTRVIRCHLIVFWVEIL